MWNVSLSDYNQRRQYCVHLPSRLIFMHSEKVYERLAALTCRYAFHCAVTAGMLFSTVARLWDEWLGNWGLIPGRGRQFSVLQRFQSSHGPLSPYPLGTGDTLSWGVKLTSHMHLLSRTRMRGSIPSTLIRFHGIMFSSGRNNFAFNPVRHTLETK
jgi:hypothetical protein